MDRGIVQAAAPQEVRRKAISGSDGKGRGVVTKNEGKEGRS